MFDSKKNKSTEMFKKKKNNINIPSRNLISDNIKITDLPISTTNEIMGYKIIKYVTYIELIGSLEDLSKAILKIGANAVIGLKIAIKNEWTVKLYYGMAVIAEKISLEK